MKHKLFLIILFITSSLITPVFAQEEGTNNGESEEPASEDSGFSFGFGLGIGVSTFPNNDGSVETYNNLKFKPDIAFGEFGIGLDIPINYRFTDSSGNSNFQVRQEDWVPDEDTNALELYLPKLNYIRWAHKGDPLYIKIGTVEDALLGNGFIMANYSNGLYLPDRKIIGLSFDLDGNLFAFPYVGFESFIANLSAFDVFGFRLYTRPFAGSELPLLPDFQLGTTFAFDTDPYYFARKNDNYTGDTTAEQPVMVWGFDVFQPILKEFPFTLNAFGDVVLQKKGNGGMLGVGGRLVEIITYSGQIRLLGDNFIPTYFDSAYDIQRPQKYAIYKGDVSIPGYTGWLSSAGLSLLEDKIVFNATLDGPFTTPAGIEDKTFYNPHLRVVFLIAEGVLPGMFFDAAYDKKNIDHISDLAEWQQDSYMEARFHYKTGPAIITVYYTLRYDLTDNGYKPITSGGIETTIGF